MKFNPVVRIRLISFFIVALVVLFVVRLFYIQIVRGEYYSDKADQQYMHPVANIFDRGAIYFTTKNGDLISAATLKRGYKIALNPMLLASSTKEDVFTKLFPLLLSLPRDDFMAKADKKNDPYEELVTRVDESTAKKIIALKIRGLVVSETKWRYYPAGPLAAHTIGLMAYKGNDYLGRYGIEKTYNDVLTRSGEHSFVNFFAEVFSGLGRGLAQNGERGEGDVVLTIEPTVQNYLEQVLAATNNDWHPTMISGLIIDPQTGEIKAMAALPNFNPNEKQSDLSVLPNPLVEHVYELGSIMKPLTMAAGLDTKAVTATTTYDDTGCLTLNKKTICNYDRKARGVISMQEVLNQSLNLGATFIEQQIGKDKFRQYFLNYGLGTKTDIDLPGEVSGLVQNLSSKEDVNFATAAFGQGIAVTPIAMVRALSALGNGGYLIKPHLVKSIQYETTLTENIKLPTTEQVIKPATSREITRMLVEVVDKKLANGKVKMPHTSIAAKTGTAQLVNVATKGYYDDRYLHSFFGYFPASNPRFLVFLMMVYPKNVNYASETLAMPFSDLTKFLINYYEIPPDR